MKLSAFKNRVQDYLILLKASAINTWQIETAYWTNNWTNLLSTTFYNLVLILFFKIIFANTKQIAGYNFDEALFFYFIGQLCFYTLWTLFITNLKNIIKFINNGNLDLILTKPLPHLFYLSTKQLNLFSGLRDALPTLIIISYFINWSNLAFTFLNITIGLIILICGIYLLYFIFFLAVLPAFWFGESSQLFESVFSILPQEIPYEGYPKSLKAFFTTLLPTLFAIGISSSVMLGKTPAIPMLLYTFIITIIIFFIQNKLWNFALRNYSSASS